jgi:O-antigen/teichoic acid export membrane protein
MRWVLPVNLGYWNSLYVILSYSLIFQFGVFNGLNRELPYLFGKGDNQSAIKYVQSSQYLAYLLFFLSLIVGGFVCAYLFIIKADYVITKSVFVLILLVAFNFLQNFLLVTFRSNQSFLKLAYIYIFQSIVLLASILLVLYYGYNGFLIRLVIVTLSLFVLTFCYRPLKVKSVLSLNVLRSLLNIGFPFFIMAYLQTLTSSFTRIAILYFSSVLFVGLFSPALAVIAAMMTIPTTIAQFLSPKMSYTYGKTGNKTDLWIYVKKSSIYIVISLAPIVAIGYFVLPYFVGLFFPAYTEGIFAAQIVLLSSIFNGLTIANNSLISIRANKEFLFLTIYKVISYLILIFLFAKLFDSILTGVAVGYFISEMLFGILSIIVCYKTLLKDNG